MRGKVVFMASAVFVMMAAKTVNADQKTNPSRDRVSEDDIESRDVRSRLFVDGGTRPSAIKEATIRRWHVGIAAELEALNRLTLEFRARYVQPSVVLPPPSGASFDTVLRLPGQLALGAGLRLTLLRFKYANFAVTGDYEAPASENEEQMDVQLPPDPSKPMNGQRLYQDGAVGRYLWHGWSVGGRLQFHLFNGWVNPWFAVRYESEDNRFIVVLDKTVADAASELKVGVKNFYRADDSKGVFTLGAEARLWERFLLQTATTAYPTDYGWGLTFWSALGVEF